MASGAVGRVSTPLLPEPQLRLLTRATLWSPTKGVEATGEPQSLSLVPVQARSEEGFSGRDTKGLKPAAPRD